MAEQPDAIRLLDLARHLLRDELAASLPPERQHAARLAARAMEIAACELGLGQGRGETAREDLARLLPDDRDESDSLASTETPAETEQRLTWRLVAEIRSGRRDADTLTNECLLRVAQSNLQLLARRDRKGHGKHD